MRELEGNYQAYGLRIGVVVSRFNDTITGRLLEGALDCLCKHGVADNDITVVWVPGAFEIPLLAKKLAASGQYDAVICLGAVIRGATAHFDYVSGQVASGTLSASLDTGVPVLFGVLTTDTIEQAVERSGTKAGNKGFEVAMGAIEMATLCKALCSQCAIERVQG